MVVPLGRQATQRLGQKTREGRLETAPCVSCTPTVRGGRASRETQADCMLKPMSAGAHCQGNSEQVRNSFVASKLAPTKSCNGGSELARDKTCSDLP
ncbi:MAG: hypothetical protein BWZ07_03056 [Alphaproteobacteria bacterium ADurb.BinA280]|nr:MAG: hypothetical protein BWZ07_03056 [Alphaproteobacteria bacterium ADurb.BinA280]